MHRAAEQAGEFLQVVEADSTITNNAQ
jgi:hypothetical protein